MTPAPHAGADAGTPTGCAGCVGRRSLLRGVAGLAGAAVVTGASAAAAAGSWRTLGPASDVPVGSGTYYPNGGNRIVVTQPRAGVYRAFSGYCPHQGGDLAQFPARLIQCTSHGSQFRIRTGAVVRGPATQPLSRREVRVRNATIQVR